MLPCCLLNLLPLCCIVMTWFYLFNMSLVFFFFQVKFVPKNYTEFVLCLAQMIPQGHNISRSPIPVKTWMVSPWSWCVGSKLFKHQNVHKHDCKIGEGRQTFSLPPAQSQTALLHWSGWAVLSRWIDDPQDYDVTLSRQDSDFKEFGP